jgi:hypothetical protein
VSVSSVDQQVRPHTTIGLVSPRFSGVRESDRSYEKARPARLHFIALSEAGVSEAYQTVHYVIESAVILPFS